MTLRISSAGDPGMPAKKELNLRLLLLLLLLLPGMLCWWV
jgi:hypothetical protein